MTTKQTVAENHLVPATPAASTGGTLLKFITGGKGNDTLNGSAAAEIMLGLAGNDRLNGNAGNDKLYGGNGNDILSGGIGQNMLNGGNGDDTYLFGKGHNTVVSNIGRDSVHFSDGIGLADITLKTVGKNWVIDAKGGSMTLVGQADGPAVADTFQVSGKIYAAHDFAAALAAGKTGKTLTGTDGDDVLRGTEYADTISGGKDGQDTLYGNGSDDVISEKSLTYWGSEPDDKLYGGAGNDKLYAATGNDLLDGGTGRDHMEGGDHSDTYLFGRDYGQDTLFDYNFQPDEEFLLHKSNANTVRFSNGLTLDDLTLNISSGYDRSLIKNMPEIYGYTGAPLLEGDTWKIGIKGTADTLTILNQSPLHGAVDQFQIGGKTYTAGEILQHFYPDPGQITTLHNHAVSSFSDGKLIVYGTSQNDANLTEGSFQTENSPYNTDRLIYGGAGNDTVELAASDFFEVSFYGGTGNDVFTANRQTAVFEGGAGNDTVTDLYNSEAANTIIFGKGDGRDTVESQSATPNAVLHFSDGLTLSDLVYSQTAENAVVSLKNSADSVSISLTDSNGDGKADTPALQKIRFDNGKTHNISEISGYSSACADAVNIPDAADNAGIL
ncbi:hypothetical protein BG910_01680 [Neisseria chenwenguii]|uniref:Type I secretion protein n=1 Tax=Neisseria chenwenguii TaxID=1853278 RepID=A0A220RZP5_9NEIS|nr:calcium-binding protein [Neisseria chenwenguii]ASK26622.1 hypothetical protein BG910_01680 [Neisseria chenwenguii]